jgi:hypothetical protein
MESVNINAFATFSTLKQCCGAASSWRSRIIMAEPHHDGAASSWRSRIIMAEPHHHSGAASSWRSRIIMAEPHHHGGAGVGTRCDSGSKPCVNRLKISISHHIYNYNPIQLFCWETVPHIKMMRLRNIYIKLINLSANSEDT